MGPVTTYVVQVVITVVGIAALATVLLYGARRVGVGRALGPLELVGRLHLEGRRAVYLVRVGSEVYVLAASEAGLVKLGVVGQETLPPPAESPASFGEVLARVLGRQAEADRASGDAEPRSTQAAAESDGAGRASDDTERGPDGMPRPRGPSGEAS